MIVGTGIDIQEIVRIEDVWEKHKDKFLHKVFTPREHDYCLSMPDPAQHLAGRFSAKEAILKVLGKEHGVPISWTDVEVVKGNMGRPEVVLHRGAADLAQAFNIERFHVTISHSDHYVVACAIAER